MIERLIDDEYDQDDLSDFDNDEDYLQQDIDDVRDDDSDEDQKYNSEPMKK